MLKRRNLDVLMTWSKSSNNNQIVFCVQGIESHYKNLAGRRKEECKVLFLRIISKKLTFGSAFFEVRVSWREQNTLNTLNFRAPLKK